MFRILAVFFVLFLLVQSAAADDKQVFAALGKVISSSPVRTGFLVIDLQTGKELYGHRQNERFVPASILKLLSSYAALKQLGPEFRFETAIFLERSGDGGSVYIKGGGDPVLRTEELEILARRIQSSGIKRVNGLYVDTGLFSSTRPRVGQRAYGAGSSALVFNFNSLLFEICPTVVGKDARILLDPYEYQVPLAGKISTVSGSVPRYSIDEGASGKYQLSGSIGARLDCGRHYRNIADSTGYFLRVLSQRLSQMGIRVDDTGEKTVPARAVLVHTHQSKPLSSILEDLNHFSTNLIAEQIVTLLGRQTDGRFSHAAGVQELERVTGLLGAPATLFDASGLSRENQTTPRLFTEVLKTARADVRINVEFEKSLSVLGRNGTLKGRAKDDTGIVLRAKTGSLTNVSTLAGYLYPPSARELAFVLIQNGSADRHAMHSRENKILALLNQL